MPDPAPDLGGSESFGVLLRTLREQAGLSQSALARQAGLDPSFVNRLESGRRGRTGHAPPITRFPRAEAIPSAAWL